MSTAPIRKAFISLVADLTSREVQYVHLNGSRSIVEAGDRGPLFLMRAGTLDREHRLTTEVRGVDLRALAERPVAAVAFLCEEFGGPVVVPANVLLSHLDVARQRRVLHVTLGRDGELTLRETGHDLSVYRGDASIRRLVAEPNTAATPDLSHAAAQNVVAALGYLRGYRVHVPAADRGRMIRALSAGADPRTWTALPHAAARLRTLQFADVVFTRPGEDWPRLVVEVEHDGNIDDALARSARTIATLRRAGAPWLPRVVIVAAGRRRQEVEEKRREALYEDVGLTERCSYWSYDVLWTAYSWWRRRRLARARHRRRLARAGLRA